MEEMVLRMMGSLLLLIPFVVLMLSSGGVPALMVLLAAHSGIAFGTQLFGIFSYPVVVVLHLVFIGLVVWWHYSSLKNIVRTTKVTTILREVDWMLVGVVFLSIYFLGSVHYDYQGLYNNALSPKYMKADHLNYPYPYFPDEWYAIAFVQDATVTKQLPLTNPLQPGDTEFFNIQFPFHALIAELFVLVRLDPLTHYTTLSIGMNTLLIAVLYTIQRRFEIPILIAGATSALALLITSGANVPGIWTMIPFTFGMLALLLGFASYPYTKALPALLAAFLYPPIMALYVPLLVWGRSVKVFMVSMLSGVVLALLYVVNQKSTGELLTFVQEKIWYQSLLGSAIPLFLPHYIMPPILIVLAVFGVIPSWRKVPVLVLVCGLGLLFWLAYLMTPWRLLIGFERVVIVVAFLCVVLAGFGLQYLLTYLEAPWLRRFIPIMLMAIVVVSSGWYTERSAWIHLIAYDPVQEIILMPGAPATVTLTESDRALFASYQHQTFLSPPWKGTALGVTTTNIPVVTQPGTITHNFGLYHTFMRGSCTDKQKIVNEHDVSLVYTPSFSCSHFTPVGTSSEGLVVQKVKAESSTVLR